MFIAQSKQHTESVENTWAQVKCLMPAIAALERRRQEDSCKLEGSLGYLAWNVLLDTTSDRQTDRQTMSYPLYFIVL